MSRDKDYLGDGAYIDHDGHGQIILTAENGSNVFERIYLDTPYAPGVREIRQAYAGRKEDHINTLDTARKNR